MRTAGVQLCLAILLGWEASAQPIAIPLPRPTLRDEPIIEMDVDPIPPIVLGETLLVDQRSGARAPAISMERAAVPVAVVIVVGASAGSLVSQLMADVPWREAGPAGSTLAIVRYGEDVEEVLAPTSVDSLPAGQFDALARRSGVRELGAGLKRAIDMLSEQLVPRRLLIVVGDGAGDGEQLADVAFAARRAGVDVLLLDTGDDGTALEAFPSARRRTVRTAADGVRAIREEFSQQVARYRVRFDGSALSWDGEWHQLSLVSGDVMTHHVTTTLPALYRRGWWHWLLAVGAGLTLVLVGIASRRPQ